MNSTPGMCARFWRLPVIRLSTTRTRCAAADELFREMGTDEAGAAGDEVGSHTARYLSKNAAEAGPLRGTRPTRVGRDPRSGPGEKVSQSAGKPNPVPAIPCGLRRGDDHSSSPAIARRVQQPTRWLWTGRPQNATLFGLAPCGVLPAIRVATNAVRSYRTFSPLLAFVLRTSAKQALNSIPELASPKRRRREGGRYIFCATIPSSCPARALPGALPFGVRTFLPPPPLALRPVRKPAVVWPTATVDYRTASGLGSRVSRQSGLWT